MSYLSVWIMYIVYGSLTYDCNLYQELKLTSSCNLYNTILPLTFFWLLAMASLKISFILSSFFSSSWSIYIRPSLFWFFIAISIWGLDWRWFVCGVEIKITVEQLFGICRHALRTIHYILLETTRSYYLCFGILWKAVE